MILLMGLIMGARSTRDTPWIALKGSPRGFSDLGGGFPLEAALISRGSGALLDTGLASGRMLSPPSPRRADVSPNAGSPDLAEGIFLWLDGLA